jgi:hypothetical protein
LENMVSSSDGNGISRADFLRGMASAGLAMTLVGQSAQASAQNADPIPKSGSAAKPATTAITTGGLPFASAEADGLAIVDAPDPSDAVIRSALMTSYPVGAFSNLVCTEVA